MASKEELKQRLVTGHVITQTDIQELIDVAGKKGDPGEKGNPGAKGNPGKDGFGTEAQYNDIIARLEKLETPPE